MKLCFIQCIYCFFFGSLKSSSTLHVNARKRRQIRVGIITSVRASLGSTRALTSSATRVSLSVSRSLIWPRCALSLKRVQQSREREARWNSNKPALACHRCSTWHVHTKITAFGVFFFLSLNRTNALTFRSVDSRRTTAHRREDASVILFSWP